MNIKRILIPTDFSETAQLAIAHGAYMAHLFNAKIFLLHSVESSAFAVIPEEPNFFIEAELIAEQTINEKLNQVANKLIKKYNVDITTLMVAGKPAKKIAEAVEENNIDMVIMGTHGASGFKEFFIGSNAYKATHLTPCPIISIQKATKKIGFSNIIMPIGNDLHSRQKTNNIIELATKYKSTVHILGLLETDDTLDESKFEIKLDSVEHSIKHAHIPFTRMLVRGHNLAIEAMKYSEKVGGDLIVVMTGHESDLPEKVLGTFTEQIVNHSKIPVMSITPEETTTETFDITGGIGIPI